MAGEETPKKQTRAPGERSRARVVEQAAQLATIEGIEGISIGRLADATGIAKSSVYALFGSKEDLQLATINAARDSFIIEVVVPALRTTEPGRQRLLALCEGFLSYVERPPRSAAVPDASATRSLASSSSGATCSDAKPWRPSIEVNSPSASIQTSSPSNSEWSWRERTSSAFSTTTWP